MDNNYELIIFCFAICARIIRLFAFSIVVTFTGNLKF